MIAMILTKPNHAYTKFFKPVQRHAPKMVLRLIIMNQNPKKLQTAKHAIHM